MAFSNIFLFLSFVFFVIFFMSYEYTCYARDLSVLFTGIVSFFSLYLLIFYYYDGNFYDQKLLVIKYNINILNIFLPIGLDGISIFFFFLSAFLIFLCTLFIWHETMLKEYLLCFLILELFLLGAFSSLDILFFYIFFESILIPMYFVIGFWGSRERKIRASYLFFFFTFIGSLCMLLSLLYLYRVFGTYNFEYLFFGKLSFNQECWFWVAFFLSFAAKIPVFPFHIWLPEAHVEAPTIGSVILAGILLKLGVFGFLRFNMVLFVDATFFFIPVVYLLALLGILYASLTAIRQTDLKRIIAYSSVAHMNLIVIGIFSFNLFCLEGAIIQSISHGFVSAALFLIIGFLYNRYHTRLVSYFSGVSHTMPLYAFFFFIFILANIALPSTSNFLGEFLLLAGIFKMSFFVSVIACVGVILSGSYSLWLYNRVCFGNLKIESLIYYKDCTFKEITMLIFLLFFVVIFGIYPNFFLKCLHFSTILYLNNLFL